MKAKGDAFWLLVLAALCFVASWGAKMSGGGIEAGFYVACSVASVVGACIVRAIERGGR